MARLTPFLMFQGGGAMEAMRFYESVLPDASIGDVFLYGAGEDGPEGTVRLAQMTVAGQRIKVIDSPIDHAFGFTPAISFFLEVGDAAALDRVAGALAEGGAVLMPADRYPFAERFAWVNDRFGVSWQISTPL